MKTTEQILTEMILKEKKANELQDKSLREQEIILKMTIKKVKKITLLLSIATIINAISIILLNLWR